MYNFYKKPSDKFYLIDLTFNNQIFRISVISSTRADFIYPYKRLHSDLASKNQYF